MRFEKKLYQGIKKKSQLQLLCAQGLVIFQKQLFRQNPSRGKWGDRFRALVAKRMCSLIHQWREIGNTGVTQYRECKRCSLRSVKQQGYGYQPIDRDWLAGGKPQL